MIIFFYSLFIDSKKVSDDIRNHLQGVKIRPYDKIKADLQNLIGVEKEGKIWVIFFF